jgi:hypothetical protein
VRASAFLNHYGRREDEWLAIAQRCADVPTTLKPLGEKVAMELLEHGYVLTLVLTYVLLGLGDFERAVDRRRFAPARQDGAAA